jgi:hypothetical protein
MVLCLRPASSAGADAPVAAASVQAVLARFPARRDQEIAGQRTDLTYLALAWPFYQGLLAGASARAVGRSARPATLSPVHPGCGDR